MKPMTEAEFINQWCVGVKILLERGKEAYKDYCTQNNFEYKETVINPFINIGNSDD